MSNWIEYMGREGKKWKKRLPDGRLFRTSTMPDELKAEAKTRPIPAKETRIIKKKDGKK